MLGHMKNIKMSGLAGTLSNTIADLRTEEMKAATPFRLVNTTTYTISFIPQLLSPVAAFALFTVHALKTGDALDATRVRAYPIFVEKRGHAKARADVLVHVPHRPPWITPHLDTGGRLRRCRRTRLSKEDRHVLVEAGPRLSSGSQRKTGGPRPKPRHRT